MIYAGNNGISAGIIVAIVVPIVVALSLLIFVCWFVNRRRAKKEYKSMPEETGMIYKFEFYLEFYFTTATVSTISSYNFF